MTTNITNAMYNAIENNNKNRFFKIGFYNEERNCFEEVVRFRNSYSKTGVNYGLLQVWSNRFDFACFCKQKGFNYAGGYNKPDANLESICYQLQKDKASELNDYEFKANDCRGLINELREVLQKQYKVKLFVIEIA